MPLCTWHSFPRRDSSLWIRGKTWPITLDKARQLPSPAGRSLLGAELVQSQSGAFCYLLLFTPFYPADYLRWRLRRGCCSLPGTSSTGRAVGWEELQLPGFCLRLMLSNPSAPLLAPHRPEHQVRPPEVSGGTRAASWAEDLVEKEGVVLLSGPLSGWLTGSANRAWHWAKQLQDSAPPCRWSAHPLRRRLCSISRWNNEVVPSLLRLPGKFFGLLWQSSKCFATDFSKKLFFKKSKKQKNPNLSLRGLLCLKITQGDHGSTL